MFPSGILWIMMVNILGHMSARDAGFILLPLHTHTHTYTPLPFPLPTFGETSGNLRGKSFMEKARLGALRGP